MQFSAHTNYFQHYFFPHVTAIWNSLHLVILLLHHLFLFLQDIPYSVFMGACITLVYSHYSCVLCIIHSFAAMSLFTKCPIVRHADTYWWLPYRWFITHSPSPFTFFKTLLCFGLNATYLVRKQKRASQQIFGTAVGSHCIKDSCMQSLLWTRVLSTPSFCSLEEKLSFLDTLPTMTCTVFWKATHTKNA